MRTMVIRVPELTSYATVRLVAVSLPYVAELVDGRKYYMPADLPRLQGTELYRAKAPRKAPRGPSLRSLVKLALKCQSAEELGKQLKRRYERQQRHQGIEPGRTRQAETELDMLIGKA